MTFHFSKNKLFIFAYIVECVFLLIADKQFNFFQIQNVLGILTLFILPGLLTVVGLRLKVADMWGYAGLVVGLSALELMVVGLLGNTFLPYIGIVRPLDRPTLIIEFALLVNTLIAVIWVLVDDIPPLRFTTRFFSTARDWFFAFFPSLFVLCAIAGSTILNNGGDGVVTLVMLIGIGIYVAALLWKSRSLDKNVIPTALYFIALSLLLMTSLRGWYITGHDIQREFGVFQLAKDTGVWNIAVYRDAYNACMSITILPTMVSNLLQIPDPYIFKLVFQFLFAFVPVLIFLYIRKYVSELFALLSVLYVVAFPTFFGDMPFLVRQEMAFLFFVLMLYVLFDTVSSVGLRRFVFFLFGIGMVLSHYATTYTVVAILLFLVVARPIAHFIGKRLHGLTLFKNSSLTVIRSLDHTKTFVSVWMLTGLILASFLWSSVLTNTASESLTRVVIQTLGVIRQVAGDEARSNDISYSIFSTHEIDLDVLFDQYKKDVVAPARSSKLQAFYSSDNYSAYSTPLMHTTQMPLTALGERAQAAGIPVTDTHYFVRQGSAKAIQVLTIIGIVAAFVSAGYFITLLETEYILLSLGSLLFVAAQVVLPILSTEYGILRAFQQALFFLSVFLVIGSATLLFFIPKRLRMFLVSALAIFFFYSSTGVFTQLLGGYGAQVHLNNSGQYYDDYYIHSSEISAGAYLKKRTADLSTIQSSTVLSSMLSIFQSAHNELYPGLVRKDTYTFIGYQAVIDHQTTINYKGSKILYNYPITFLDDNKNRIYDNGDAYIYR